MGRAGAGSSGGSRSSGGRSGGSRSSGGHRIGSSRAGSSSSFGGSFGGSSSFGGSFGGFNSSRSTFGGIPTGYDSPFGGPININTRSPRRLSGGFIAILILLFILGYFLADSSSVKSTIQRTKLESGLGYDSNCITDELDWFDNESRTESKLKSFYEETGIQPYILFVDYDSSVKTDSDKEDWAEAYYNENIDREDAFLYVYFAEKDIDDVGYMCYVNGYQTSSVMDSEAVDIFWNYLDRYWYTDLSTDDVILKTFDNTADTIMRVSTTGADIGLAVVIGGAVIVVLLIGFTWWKKHRQAEKERAEETARILNTPMNDLVNTAGDDLADKYL